jgi:quinol monooxygenase YgiN
LPEVNPLAESNPLPATAEAPPAAGTRVHATIRIVIPARKRKEVLVILGSIIEQTRLEEGCLSCRLYLDAQEERAVMLEETWESERHLERHLQSDRFRTVLLAVEMAVQPPEIRFDRVSRSTGIGTIIQARGERDSLGGVHS